MKHDVQCEVEELPNGRIAFTLTMEDRELLIVANSPVGVSYNAARPTEVVAGSGFENEWLARSIAWLVKGDEAMPPLPTIGMEDGELTIRRGDEIFRQGAFRKVEP